MELLDGELAVMVFPVHLQRSAVEAILDCPIWRMFTGPETLKPVALQLIWLFKSPQMQSGVPKAFD